MYGHPEDLYLRRRLRLRRLLHQMGEPSDFRDSLALSNLLLCHESESSLNEDNETIERSDQKPHFASSSSSITIGDEDYVAELVLKENQRFETEPTKTTSSFDRLIAIDWILTVRNHTNKKKFRFFTNFSTLISSLIGFFQTRTRFGFQNQTAYIAISYLDLFLKRRFIGVSIQFLKNLSFFFPQSDLID